MAGIGQEILNFISDRFVYDPEESAAAFLKELNAAEREHQGYLDSPEGSENALHVYQGHLDVIREVAAGNANNPNLDLILARVVNEIANSTENAPIKADPSGHDRIFSPILYFTRGGDCDDAEFAKYTMLKAVGVEPDNMRFAGVSPDSIGASYPAHVVLLVQTQNSGIAVLDSLKDEVQTFKNISDAPYEFFQIVDLNKGEAIVVIDDVLPEQIFSAVSTVSASPVSAAGTAPGLGR